MNRLCLFGLLSSLVLSLGCHRHIPPEASYGQLDVPAPPDYQRLTHWSSHPDKADPADARPSDLPPEEEAEPLADVFFIHPTTFHSQTQWNASLDEAELNTRTDEWAVKNQASIFNGSCRVYAPRYRQMTMSGFFSADKQSERQALTLAYGDVRAAFEHYLAHENHGRPIVIAGHSQGAAHGIRLVQEFFDGKPRQAQLVAAYLPGWPFPADTFAQVPVCQRPEQTGCVVSWCAWQEGIEPKNLDTYYRNAVVVNPVTWRTEGGWSPQHEHDGFIARKYDKIRPQALTAQVHQGILWVSKPLPIMGMKNYHIGDLNLFWLDTRYNVARRLSAFLKQGADPQLADE